MSKIVGKIVTKSGKSYEVTEDNFDEVLNKIGSNEPYDFISDKGVVCFSFAGTLNYN